ncbi:MAG: glycosyltransferase family 2 protein [Ignavibacteriaceae bacterium]|nr:glycosyltransferase family 2 protein [Ignavibacteriaceae bacterium]
MKNRFSSPDWLQKHLDIPDTPFTISESRFEEIRNKMKKFTAEDPEVSVMIPCWNEEPNIVRTISTFSEQTTQRRTEIVFVNNNSTDRTAELLDKCGAVSIFVEKQGISFARQAGLERAKGKYHLCADADSFYPPDWIETMVKALEDDSVTCAYGRYSFIPPEGTSRFALGVHEIIAESLFTLRNRRRQYLNVGGANFGFRTADGKKVGGFNTTRPKWSDGWMAMTLADIGKIQLVKSNSARVWTSARRLMADGSLGKAFVRRVKKEIGRLYEYVFPVEHKK